MHNLNESIASVWIEHNQNTIAHRDYTPYGPNFITILAFLKNWPLLGGYFGSWGHALVTVAVVEWLKQESMYGMSTGTEKWPFVERWPLWRDGRWWRFDCLSLLLADCVKYWRTNYGLSGILTYRKIPNISPGAYIFQRPFLRGLFWGGAYIRRGLSTEGNLRFKIDCASLIVGSKFTVFALFLYLRAIFQGAYIWRGDLAEGFSRHRFAGLIFGGLIHGGAYFRNFTVLTK